MRTPITPVLVTLTEGLERRGVRRIKQYRFKIAARGNTEPLAKSTEGYNTLQAASRGASLTVGAYVKPMLGTQLIAGERLA